MNSTCVVLSANKSKKLANVITGIVPSAQTPPLLPSAHTVQVLLQSNWDEFLHQWKKRKKRPEKKLVIGIRFEGKKTTRFSSRLSLQMTQVIHSLSLSRPQARRYGRLVELFLLSTLKFLKHNWFLKAVITRVKTQYMYEKEINLLLWTKMGLTS